MDESLSGPMYTTTQYMTMGPFTFVPFCKAWSKDEIVNGSQGQMHSFSTERMKMNCLAS